MSSEHSGPLVHAIAAAEWAAAVGTVEPPSLAEEGFIHLSRPDQIAWVANQRFAGRTDMVLLVVDQSRLPLPVVWEDCYETGQEFPHLYEALPVSAVTGVIEYVADASGVYQQPSSPVLAN